MPIIENPHSHQTQTTSLDTINKFKGLNYCLRAKFVDKVAQQLDGPDLAYYCQHSRCYQRNVGSFWKIRHAGAAAAAPDIED